MSTNPSTRDRFVKTIVILAVAGGAFAAGLAYAAQPHMEAALNARAAPSPPASPTPPSRTWKRR